MDSSENEKCIDGVVLSILALFNDSGGGNMPRDLAAYTGFSHIHCAPRRGGVLLVRSQIGESSSHLNFRQDSRGGPGDRRDSMERVCQLIALRTMSLSNVGCQQHFARLGEIFWP